jgi:hypothetical protein
MNPAQRGTEHTQCAKNLVCACPPMESYAGV